MTGAHQSSIFRCQRIIPRVYHLIVSHHISSSLHHSWVHRVQKGCYPGGLKRVWSTGSPRHHIGDFSRSNASQMPPVLLPCAKTFGDYQPKSSGVITQHFDSHQNTGSQTPPNRRALCEFLESASLSIFPLPSYSSTRTFLSLHALP